MRFSPNLRGFLYNEFLPSLSNTNETFKAKNSMKETHTPYTLLCISNNLIKSKNMQCNDFILECDISFILILILGSLFSTAKLYLY